MVQWPIADKDLNDDIRTAFEDYSKIPRNEEVLHILRIVGFPKLNNLWSTSARNCPISDSSGRLCSKAIHIHALDSLDPLFWRWKTIQKMSMSCQESELMNVISI